MLWMCVRLSGFFMLVGVFLMFVEQAQIIDLSHSHRKTGFDEIALLGHA